MQAGAITLRLSSFCLHPFIFYFISEKPSGFINPPPFFLPPTNPKTKTPPTLTTTHPPQAPGNANAHPPSHYKEK